MTTCDSKGRFFLQNESIRIDSHNESNRIDSNRELECSTGWEERPRRDLFCVEVSRPNNNQSINQSDNV